MKKPILGRFTSQRQVRRFARLVKKKRTKLGWTQADLATFSGLSRQCVSSMEGAKHWPTQGTVKKVAKGFRCKTSELIGCDKGS